MIATNNQDIGVVGSPSTTTEFTIDLLQEASEDRLVGALVAFDATQNGAPITSVGQIVGIELRNRWHEDATFRNLIKRTGEIPPITSRQDTRTAQLAIGATFKNASNPGYEPDLLGMVPPTGTRVVKVDQRLIDSLLAIYQQHKEIFYLGNAYANDVRYPMWFKHFGSGERGAGEAYHTGIFGKTGSGKSGLAKMVLLGYARHPELGILIIDPQGEFSQELKGESVGQQRLPVKDALDGMRRNVEVYGIQDIQLREWDLFEELLVDLGFTEQLGIRVRSNSRTAAEVIRTSLERGKYNLNALTSKDALGVALKSVTSQQNARAIYSTPSRASQLIEDVSNILNSNRFDDIHRNRWMPLANLFSTGNGRRNLYGIVRDLSSSTSNPRGRPVISIDLSERGNRRFWSESLQQRLIKELLDNLTRYASQDLGLQESANVLVMLDEAARLAPSGSLDSGSEAGQLRITLRNAARETRKYGIGWFFISQTLGGIDNEILQQLRTLFFGFGLALGDEFRKLREFAGGDDRAMELYQSFRDPHSAPSRRLREFPFMAVGPVSPLSFSGRPMFFSAFTAAEFLEANHL